MHVYTRERAREREKGEGHWQGMHTHERERVRERKERGREGKRKGASKVVALNICISLGSIAKIGPNIFSRQHSKDRT